jgi:hypothetical protein
MPDRRSRTYYDSLQPQIEMNSQPILNLGYISDLAKSMMSCNWAVSIFVAKNLASLTTSSTKPPVEQVAESFERVISEIRATLPTLPKNREQVSDSPNSAPSAPAGAGTAPIDSDRDILSGLFKVTEAAQREFATSPLVFGGFQAGDLAQRALVDLAVDVLALRAFRPDYLADLGDQILRRSVAAARLFETAHARQLAVQQLRNTLGVIRLVNDSPPPNSGEPADYPLESRVTGAYELGKYPALWAVEGLGQDYAENQMQTGMPVRGLLTTGKGAQLPPQSLLMMHAGAGLAFAKHAIVAITPYSSDQEIDGALRVFLELVHENSREGYRGAAMESLGLVTRTWYAPLMGPVSRRLPAIDPLAAQYFWHGAGRAMVFSPINMLPGFSPFETADNEPPDETARRSARSGVTWAFTLINLLQPEITANFLLNNEAEMAKNDAFRDGVTSTLIMASEMVPGNTNVTRFCQYQPDASKPALVESWQRNIGTDCATRVEAYRQTLGAHARLDEVFRYQSLPELVAALDHRATSSVPGV